MKLRRRMSFRCVIIIATLFFQSCTAIDEYANQQIVYKQNRQRFNESLLITKLLNLNNSFTSTEVPSNSFIDNQSLDATSTSDKAQQKADQSINDKNPKFFNKNVSNTNKKNAMLFKKSLTLSQSKSAEDGSWTCPNITDNRSSLECGCDVPLTLRCSGDAHSLTLIADVLRKSKSTVSILDCTLKNVTVLNEARIFDGVSLSGLFISSGEIKRVHRLAFTGLKSPIQILGLPNNALSSVPSNSLQQLTSLDRLDLSNNEIKILSPTDFLFLQKLTYLEISENRISSISPKTFLPLRNLVTLKLNGNKLGSSPGSLKTIAECINLIELDLQANLIKGPLTSDTLPVLRSLEILNLERNSFSSVGNGTFKEFSKLLKLSLRHNQIDVLENEAFIGLNSLQKLDLGYNGILAVSERSLKHMNRLRVLDFTHNFLRAITLDIIAPLPMLQEICLDGNDISIVEKNAFNSANHLKNLSLRDNPISCDCKLQYFVEWLGNMTQLLSRDLMGFCKTPPFLEGAQLSQLSVDSLTCTETHIESDNDNILSQANKIFSDFSDNFTVTMLEQNYVRFEDYNLTALNDLNLHWTLHLNDSVLFHSLMIFEGSTIRIRLDNSTLTYRMVNDQQLIVSVPSKVNLNVGYSYEFCLVFTEDNFQFLLGCSSSFPLVVHRTINVDLNSRILKSSIQESDISSFEKIADSKNNQLFMNDDMMTIYSTIRSPKDSHFEIEHDVSISAYPSKDFYNSLWPNISLSILIICMSISIVYILWTRYRLCYKSHQTESISPSYSEDSINTQLDDDSENTTNKYVKLQATTAL